MSRVSYVTTETTISHGILWSCIDRVISEYFKMNSQAWAQEVAAYIVYLSGTDGFVDSVPWIILFKKNEETIEF